MLFIVKLGDVWFVILLYFFWWGKYLLKFLYLNIGWFFVCFLDILCNEIWNYSRDLEMFIMLEFVN